MCPSTTSTSNSTLEGGKLVKFVELLVHDFLQAKGFTATAEKFAEECSKYARDRHGGSSSGNHQGAGSSVVSAGSTAGNNEPTVDDASCWYCLADKLALSVRVLDFTINPSPCVVYSQSDLVTVRALALSGIDLDWFIM